MVKVQLYVCRLFCRKTTAAFAQKAQPTYVYSTLASGFIACRLFHPLNCMPLHLFHSIHLFVHQHWSSPHSVHFSVAIVSCVEEYNAVPSSRPHFYTPKGKCACHGRRPINSAHGRRITLIAWLGAMCLFANEVERRATKPALL